MSEITYNPNFKNGNREAVTCDHENHDVFFDYSEFAPHNLSGRIDTLLDQLRDLLHYNIDDSKKLDDQATLDQRTVSDKIKKAHYKVATRQTLGIVAGMLGAASACFDKDSGTARAVSGIQAMVQGTKEVIVTFPQGDIQKLQSILSEHQTRLQQLSKEDERIHRYLEQIEATLRKVSEQTEADLTKPFQGG